MKKFFIISLLLLISLFAAVYFSTRLLPRLKITPTPASHRENTDSLCRKLDEAAARYNADCGKLLAGFGAELEKNLSPDFSEATRSISKVVDDLCGFKVCVKLCHKAAKDKIKGTHDFMDAYIEAINTPIIQPCLRANAVASDMLQNLRLRLKERRSRYVMELATVCRNNGSDGKLPSQDLENLRNCLETFAETAQDAHLKKVMAGVGIALETIFIRETCGYIVKLFAKPAAKICTSIGVAGICAAADGPLPFGDIAGAALSLGGLAWTAWDLYDVTCVMPQKLNAELRDGIVRTKTKLLEESRSQASKTVREYQHSGDKLIHELKEQLK